MNNKLISILKYLIGWPLSAISLFFVFKLISSNLSSLNNLNSINIPLLLLGLLSFITYFFVRTYLWQTLINISGNKFDFIKSSYLWEISEVKRYTPGNIWSFLSRAKLFSDDNISKTQVGNALFNEIILIILSCFTLSYFYVSSYLNNPLISNLLFLTNIGVLSVYLLNKYLKIKFLPKENIQINLKLYLISTFAFLLFGAGTFFSAISIIYMDPRNILSLISLFVFALLVGYLSIITPMGLGVREGITTFGLSSQISLANAGLVSIFTRIIFIVSELLFLITTYILEKLKNKTYLNKLIKLISANKYLIFLSIGTLIFFIYFTVAGFLRYDNFYTGRFDLGNMDQAVWNTINGRLFQFTDANGTEIVSRLAYHADFILVLISPLYLIWSNPKMLILLQVLVVSFGSFAVYLLAKEITKHKLFSIILAFCFLLFPAIHYNLLFDFHGVTLATTFLLFTYYFFLKRRYGYFLVFALLSGICKEQIWAIVAIFGVAIIIRSYIKHKLSYKKEIVFGFLLSLFSTFLFYALIWRIIPQIRGDSHFALAFFSDFGNSTSGVFINVLSNPLKILSILLKPDNLTYFSQLLSPLGYVSLIGLPFLIFAIPDIFINTLSSNPQLHQIYYQYSSTITPFVFISAIYGAKIIVGKVRFLSFNFFAAFFIISTLISQYNTGPLPGSKKASLDMFTKPLSNAKEIESFINRIPLRYSVAATNNLGSHLSRRERIYTIPVGIENADMLLFLFNNGYSELSDNQLQKLVRILEENKLYKQIYKKDSFIVFEKRNLN